MMPRVTIGVPVYNGERYLDECLTALSKQDYPDFELIISDNASTDHTWQICQQHAATDPRIRLHRNDTNLGGHANYRLLTELAHGELFKWAAYDDLCEPTYLSRCIDTLDTAGPPAILAYPQTLLINSDSTIIGSYADRMNLRHPQAWRRVAGMAHGINLCHAHFGVVRLAALRRTGMIRPYLSSDYTLLMELAALGQIHEVPEPLFLRRIHTSSTRQGTDTSLTIATNWFGPQHQQTRGYRRHMVTATVHALATRDQPLLTRAATTSAFLGTWYTRRTRVTLGRWRRSLTRGLDRRG